MNKKIITALVALTLVLPSTANAALKNRTLPAPTLAILDTGIDTSLPIFKDRIVAEVCILETKSCPNGQAFMEGPGAASVPSNLINLNGFDHGTQMAYVAANANPDLKIVFVKIIGQNPSGSRQLAGEATVYNALQWVLDNKDRLNIQAVSMAQAHHNLLIGTDYCPKTPITESKVKALVSAGIPVFFPAGNARDYVRIDWPACIPDSIAVGATMPTGEIAIYSNNDNNLIDFFALGTMVVYGPGNVKANIAGTSGSVQNAAANWIQIKSAKPSLTYQQMYDLIKRTAKPTFNSKVKSGFLIDPIGAING
jgi:hypothetical protein